MQKTHFWLIAAISATLSTLVFAQPECNKGALACYLLEPENIPQPWVLSNKQYDKTLKVSTETYNLVSQFWPKAEMSAHGILWKHTLVIYQPDTVKTQQALLFVDSGTLYPNTTVKANYALSASSIFASIAAATHSIVIDLQDIPNQYLTFDDDVPRKEDSIIAYTWNRYMDNPKSGAYWPAHLPMTKAVIKAMDATQEITAQHNILIDHFVVAGLSKRGLTTWLAALSDERINAIIPIVIDILNTKENLNLIYTSYNNNWPPAFHDYVEANIPERIDTPEFTQLMHIEDPLAYLTCEQCDVYKHRLQIPKYIISASGDDFFVPDSLNLYFDQLPGQKSVRVVPNQSHDIDINIIAGSILAYYQMIIYHLQPPSLSWQVNSVGELLNVTTDQRPASVKLWEAENPEMRDFRMAAHITYVAKELNGHCTLNHCQYPVSTTPPEKGWKSSFVEVTFKEPLGHPLVLTTSAYVTPALKRMNS